jgi:hypothetical protein
MSGFKGSTASGAPFIASTMTHESVFGRERLLNAVVEPWPVGIPVPSNRSTGRYSPENAGLEVYPNGVFLEGRRLVGSDSGRVVVIKDAHEYEVIDLTSAEETDLVRHGMNSPVWKRKVEPVIDSVFQEVPRL